MVYLIVVDNIIDSVEIERDFDFVEFRIVLEIMCVL